MKLKPLLKSKNPYLFRAKAVSNAAELVEQLLDARLSSSEETIFGAFLEGLAIDVCKNAYGGRRSTTEGLDLEFERDGFRYIVSIKSGPKWGNAPSIKKMIQAFDQARRIAGVKHPLVAINGCCYGRDSSPNKRGNFQKLCGQDFWSLISGDDDLYLELIEPIGLDAKVHNDDFAAAYGAVINKFTLEFIGSFCDKDGYILWDLLLRFNSQREVKPTRMAKPKRATKRSRVSKIV